jgi:hypothetical protein
VEVSSVAANTTRASVKHESPPVNHISLPRFALFFLRFRVSGGESEIFPFFVSGFEPDFRQGESGGRSNQSRTNYSRYSLKHTGSNIPTETR